MWRSTKCTNSAYKYTHFWPAGNLPGTLKVTQSVNKLHGFYKGSLHDISEHCYLESKSTLLVFAVSLKCEFVHFHFVFFNTQFYYFF